VWRADGARTGAAWLAARQHLPIGETRRRLRHARAMQLFPAIADAWAAGDIDRTHITTLLGVRTARTRAAFEADHEDLLASARSRGFVDFKRHGDTWELFRDPDGANNATRTTESPGSCT